MTVAKSNKKNSKRPAQRSAIRSNRSQSKRRPKIDPFSHHEALHVAWLISDLFSQYLHDHPFVRSEPSLRREAEKIEDQLAGFYQLVGQFSPDCE